MSDHINHDHTHRSEAERILEGLTEGRGGTSAADIQLGALIVIAHTLLAIDEKLNR